MDEVFRPDVSVTIIKLLVSINAMIINNLFISEFLKLITLAFSLLHIQTKQYNYITTDASPSFFLLCLNTYAVILSYLCCEQISGSTNEYYLNWIAMVTESSGRKSHSLMQNYYN